MSFSASGSIYFEGNPLLLKTGALPPTVASSRMSLERLIRRLVLSRYSNVIVKVGTVVGLQATSDGIRINAVQVRNSDGGALFMIDTSFFVDCSGPACGAIQWLCRANPIWTIRKESYDPHVSYSSRVIKLDGQQMARFHAQLPEQLRDTVSIIGNIGSSKSGSQIAYGISHGDNDTVIIMGAQWGHSEALPRSFDEYVEYAKLCEDRSNEGGRSEAIAAALSVLREVIGDDAAKAHPMIKYSISGMHHVRYDLSPALPSNFAAVEDSIMRLNPTFGQGAAKISQDITSLDAVLRGCMGSLVPDDFSKRFLGVQTPRNRPWFDSTRMMDYRFPTTVPMEGETLSTGKLQRKWSVLMIKLCHKDADAGTEVTKAMHNLEPGIAVLKPSFLARVLWNALKS